MESGFKTFAPIFIPRKSYITYDDGNIYDVFCPETCVCEPTVPGQSETNVVYHWLL